MTLEEMIERLQPYAAAYHDGYLFESIIAALRRLERLEKAGRAMYEAPAVDPVDGYTSSKMMRAKKQWKAATDGDNK